MTYNARSQSLSDKLMREISLTLRSAHILYSNGNRNFLPEKHVFLILLLLKNIQKSKPTIGRVAHTTTYLNS